MRKITKKLLQAYRAYLQGEEKSAATLQKYLKDVTELSVWLRGKRISKRLGLETNPHSLPPARMPPFSR